MGKGLTSELKRIWQTLQAMTGRRGLASAAPSTALGTGSICSMGQRVCMGGGVTSCTPKPLSGISYPPPRPLLQPLQSIQPLLWVLWEELGALWVQPKLWVRPSYGSTPCCGSAQAMGQPTLWVSPPPSATPAPFRSSSGISPNPNPGDGTPPVVQPQPGFLCRCFGTKPQKIEVAELTEAVPASVPQPRPAAGQLAGIVARAEAPMGMKARGRRGPAGPEARRRHGSGTGPGQRPSGAAAARRRARSRDSPSPLQPSPVRVLQGTVVVVGGVRQPRGAQDPPGRTPIRLNGPRSGPTATPRAHPAPPGPFPSPWQRNGALRVPSRPP